MQVLSKAGGEVPTVANDDRPTLPPTSAMSTAVSLDPLLDTFSFARPFNFEAAGNSQITFTMAATDQSGSVWTLDGAESIG